jgi:hypothetical protein
MERSFIRSKSNRKLFVEWECFTLEWRLNSFTYWLIFGPVACLQPLQEEKKYFHSGWSLKETKLSSERGLFENDQPPFAETSYVIYWL